MAEFNKTLALATALGSLGGFQMAPEWFLNLSRYAAFQIFVLAVLLWQGGGGGGDGNPFSWSVMFAVVFWSVMKASSYIRVTTGKKLTPLAVIAEADAQAEEEAAAEEAAAEGGAAEGGAEGGDAPAPESTEGFFSAQHGGDFRNAQAAQVQLMDAQVNQEAAGSEGFRGFGASNNYATF